jgi:hypothetical protein
MNRFLKGRRAAPWAWMQTGPLTVDPERLAAEATLARTPACTEGALSPERVAEASENEIVESAEPAPTSQEAEPATEVTNLSLNDFPALKAAMESFEKRGDPILIPINPEPSDVHTLAAEAAEGALPERAPKPRRAKPNPRKSRSKRIAKAVNLRPTAPRKPSRPKTQTEIDISHHERHCTICHHPERESIEEAFCQWRKVKFIAREFNATGGPTAIYRHARALKLFKQRNLTLRSSLEFVIEQSECVVPTAEGLVKAIRAYTRINDVGEWIDTPTTHIVKVIAMHSPDAGSRTNALPGLTLDVSKLPSGPNQGRVGLTIESSTPQPLLPGSAPRVENAVTD